jgi:hypothetical protein
MFSILIQSFYAYTSFLLNIWSDLFPLVHTDIPSFKFYYYGVSVMRNIKQLSPIHKLGLEGYNLLMFHTMLMFGDIFYGHIPVASDTV